MSNQDFPWLKSYDIGFEWDTEIEALPVFTLMDEAANKYAQRPAFNFLGKRYSWREISSLVNKFALGLQNIGVEKGTHVGVFLPNSPYYLIAYYGILKAGGTVVNLNPLYAEKELASLINDSEVDIVVTADLAMLYDKMHKMQRDTRLKTIVMCKFTNALPFPKNVLFPLVKSKDMARVHKGADVRWFHDLIQNDGAVNVPQIDPLNDVAVIQFTGGTTGIPKGAMLTHANVYANVVQSVTWFPDVKHGEQKMLGVLPFFHVFAMTAVMNFSVMAGLEIVALPRFDLKDTLKLIDKVKPHFFPAVPAIYNAINNYNDLDQFDLSSLKFCISGGAPLPVEVKKSFETITGCIVVEGYGLSESSPVACANPVRGNNVAGSIGLPVPGTVIEIIDPEDKKTPIKPGKRGELCISGPQVMKGYWKNEEATASTIINGRLHTGDIAIMDENGYVYIVDRLKDMIITNGYNVYPRNVEEAIYQHPAVEECIVAGLPDKQRGEIVKAWIKLKDGQDLSGEDLKTFLKDEISPMEIPKRIEIREEELPKTMIGKLSRKDVLAQEPK